MATEKVQLTSRPFQALFNDADYHLESAEKYHNTLVDQSKKKEVLPDQSLLKKETAHSRACIIVTILGLEAFCNSVLAKIKVREADSLPEEWELRKSQAGNWPIRPKIRCLPTFCNKEIIRPDEVFPEDDKVYEMFCELVDVRNSLAHGRLTQVVYSVTFKPDRVHSVDDRHPENFWPISGIPKDIFGIAYPHAQRAHDNLVKMIRKLLASLDCGITKAFLLDQEIRDRGRISHRRRQANSLAPPVWYTKVMSSEQ